MPEVGSIFVRIGAKIDEFKKRMDEVASRLEATSKRFESVGKKMTDMGKTMSLRVTAPIAAVGTAAFTAANDLDKAMKTIRAGTGATGKALEALNKDFQTVFKQVPQRADVVSNVLADLNTRTGLTGLALQKLTKQTLDLARVAGMDASQLVAQTTRIFGDWGIEAAKTGQTLDYLWKVSQTTGIGVDQLGRTIVQYGAPLRQMGFDFETAAAMLGKWEKEGVNAELVLGSLRIGLVNFAKAGEEPPKAMRRAIEEIKNMGSAAEANALAVEIFGARAGPDMAAAIREGRFDLDKLLKTLQASPETIAAAARETMTFGESMQQLKNQAEVALEPLGKVLLDIFEKAQPQIEAVIGFVSRLAEGFANLSPITQKVILGAVGFAAVLGPLMMVLGSITSGVGALIGFLPTLGAAFAAICSPIGLVIATIAGAITAGVLLYKNWDKVKYYGMQAWGALKKFILDRIAEMLQGIQKFASIIPGLGEKISSAIAKVQALSRREATILDARKVAFEAASAEKAADRVQVAINETKRRMASLHDIQDLVAQSGEKLAQTNDNISSSAGKVAKAAEEVKAKWEVANEALSLSLQIIQARFDVLSNKLSESKDRITLLAEKTKNLSDQMQVQQQIVENLRQAHEAAAKAKGIDAKETKELELKLVQAEAALTRMEKQMRETKRAISEQAQQFRDLAAEVDKVRQKYETDMAAALEDYQRKVEQVNERLVADERRVREEYQRSLDQRTKSLMGWVGLFDEVTKKEVAGKTLLQNLRDQVTAFKNWQANIQALVARGVDQGLIAQLKEMGPKAGPQIAALNKLTNEELKQYVDLWKEKNLLARQEAMSQLEQQRWEMQQKLMEIRSNAAQQLEIYRAEWAKKQAEIRKNAEEELNRIEKRFKEMEIAGTRYGSNLMGNFIGGIQGRMGQLQRVLENMAMMVDSYMPHSPARIGPLARIDEWGPGLVDTFVKGIQSRMPAIERAMSRMAGAFAPGGSYIPVAAGAGSTTNTTIITNTFHITVSGSTTSEQAEDLLRELARRGVRF